MIDAVELHVIICVRRGRGCGGEEGEEGGDEVARGRREGGGGDDARKADADAEVIRPFEMRARGECVGKVWSGNGETGGEGEVETPEETPEVRIAAEGARRAFADAADADAENDGEDGRRCGAKSTRDVHSGQHQGGGEDEKDAEDGASALGGDAFGVRVRGKGRDERRDVERRKTTTSCALRGPLAVSRRHTIPSEREHHRARRHQTQRERVARHAVKLVDGFGFSPLRRAVRGESVPFRFELVARLLLHQRHVVQSNL